MRTDSRKAGIAQFEGYYPYEFLRRLVGDQMAEGFLLVEYSLKEPRSGRTDIINDGVDIGDGDRVHRGF